MNTIPTTQEIIDLCISNYESIINQNVPSMPKAYINVASGIEGMLVRTLYAYAAERALQAFAISASGDDLDRIGRQQSILRHQSSFASLNVQIPASNGTIIPTARYLIGTNGIRYIVIASEIATGGFAKCTVTAEISGPQGNLAVGETMELGTQVIGAQSTATVKSIVQFGTDIEDQENYRQRILASLRVVHGGANAADYRVWGKIAGVKEIYPYSGRPGLSSVPGDRTIYVEATSDIAQDGIAPQSLLTEVKNAIIRDPLSGEGRLPLGLSDATLYVLSVVKTKCKVDVKNLTADSSLIASARQSLEQGLKLYFSGVKPYVLGVDYPASRNDRITTLSIAEVAHASLRKFGASASSVRMYFSGSTYIDDYQLSSGELIQLEQVVYV